MTKTNSATRAQKHPTARIDDLIHAIALIMARRQMEQAWPRT